VPDFSKAAFLHPPTLARPLLATPPQRARLQQQRAGQDPAAGFGYRAGGDVP
jgi:hypothetical protein